MDKAKLKWIDRICAAALGFALIVFGCVACADAYATYANSADCTRACTTRGVLRITSRDDACLCMDNVGGVRVLR